MSKGDRPAIISNISTPSAHQSTLNPEETRAVTLQFAPGAHLQHAEARIVMQYNSNCYGEHLQGRERTCCRTILMIRLAQRDEVRYQIIQRESPSNSCLLYFSAFANIPRTQRSITALLSDAKQKHYEI